ncbi:MAG: hypothetical protein ACRCUJ_09470 [Phocaeicola sp.]
MKEKKRRINLVDRFVVLCVALFCATLLVAQSPDKRSWKKRLAKQKQEQVMGGMELLCQEMGLKPKGDELICMTSRKVVSIEEVNSRFTDYTARLITSSTVGNSLNSKKKQLVYVTSLNQLLRSITTFTAAEMSSSKLLIATAAREQLRLIDAWCKDSKAASQEEQLHYQLLQYVATSF